MGGGGEKKKNITKRKIEGFVAEAEGHRKHKRENVGTNTYGNKYVWILFAR